MARGGLYTKYRRIIEMLNLRQLDVYRVTHDKAGAKDLLRIMDPSSGKIVIVDLETTREALTFGEFLERLVYKLKEQGITLDDRLVERIRRAIENLS